MAQGKRNKFNGSKIAVATAWGTATAVTAIAKTNPVRLTKTGHGLAVGDAVKIAGVGGMTELVDGIYYVVAAPTADTFDLFGVDATGYTTWTSGGTFSKATMSQFCELTNMEQSGGESPEIDASTICSTAQEFELGLSGFGDVKLEFNFDPMFGVNAALKSAKATGEQIPVKVELPANRGSMGYVGMVMAFDFNGAVNELWKGSATIKVTGNRFDYVPA